MCIGTPMPVIDCQQWQARCRDRDGSLCWVDTRLLGEVQTGDWLLVQAGSAWQRLAEPQALAMLAALETLQQAACGQPCDIQHGFADLLAQPPQLPEHLRKEC